MPNDPGAAEDKRERRRKLGLPEEQTEEEIAKEAAQAAEKRKTAEAGKLRLPVKPVSGVPSPSCQYAYVITEAGVANAAGIAT